MQGVGVMYLTRSGGGARRTPAPPATDGSYVRLIDFAYHSTLGLGVIKKRDKPPATPLHSFRPYKTERARERARARERERERDSEREREREREL